MLTTSRLVGSRGHAALALLVVSVTYFAFRENPKATAKEAAAGGTRRARAAPVVAAAEEDVPAPPRRSSSTVPARVAPAETAALAEAEAPEVVAVTTARGDVGSAGTDGLIAALSSRDEVVVAEAANALVARRATEAVEPLAGVDLERAAGSGLSIIDALGKLGGASGEQGRGVAVDRLIAMLAEEKRRGARETPGNLLQIYEALGDTGDPRAAPTLERELLDPHVARAPKVVVVASLVDLGQASSRAALETGLAAERAAKEQDSFEEEIRLELVSAIEAALGIL